MIYRGPAPGNGRAWRQIQLQFVPFHLFCSHEVGAASEGKTDYDEDTGINADGFVDLHVETKQLGIPVDSGVSSFLLCTRQMPTKWLSEANAYGPFALATATGLLRLMQAEEGRSKLMKTVLWNRISSTSCPPSI